MQSLLTSAGQHHKLRVFRIYNSHSDFLEVSVETKLHTHTHTHKVNIFQH